MLQFCAGCYVGGLIVLIVISLLRNDEEEVEDVLQPFTTTFLNAYMEKGAKGIILKPFFYVLYPIYLALAVIVSAIGRYIDRKKKT